MKSIIRQQCLALVLICLLLPIFTSAQTRQIQPLAGGCGNINFQAAVNTNIGANPSQTVSADFNKDGNPDLATLLPDSVSVAISLGNGQGGFNTSQIKVDFGRTDLKLSAIVVGDFNGDGNIDLGYTSNGQNFGQLFTIPGNGDGSFDTSQARQFVVTTGVSALGIGDFNGDGKLDICYSDRGLNLVAAILNDGDGFFLTPMFRETGGFSPSAISVGDFNNDGKLDIAVLNSPDNGDTNLISIEMGMGDGRFIPFAHLITLPAIGRALTAGDFNGDGNLDLAVTSNNGFVSVLLGDGTGDLKVVTPQLQFGLNLTAITTGDFNRDGKLDLIVADQTANKVTALVGDGFGKFSSSVSFNTAAGPIGLIAADLNKDNSLDLVVTNQTAGSLSTLLNTCDDAAASDFIMMLFPQHQEVSAGATTSFTIQLQSVGKFNQPVAFTANSMDQSLNLNFSKESIMPGETTTLSASTSMTSKGSSEITITGKVGNIVHTTTVTIDVKQPTPAKPLISLVQYAKSNLTITGSNFGSNGAVVLVNGNNINDLLVNQSDTQITLKGSKKKLKLKKGANQVIVTNNGVTSDTYQFNL